MDLRPSYADRDPLERPRVARLVVLAALLGSALALLGLESRFHQGLPGVALGSPFLLQVERILVVGAAVSGLLIFAIRGWAGYFPSKLSATGAEYAARAAVVDSVRNEDEIAELLAGLDADRTALAHLLLGDIWGLGQRIDKIEARYSKETR